MNAPLLVRDVWKTFGHIQAVRGLSLVVPAGSVYGFLGPNGAGKSTTIRMILGLQRPDSGSILLFGNRVGGQGTAVLRRIGSLVESPSLYQHLTGRENLEVHRLLLDLPKRTVDAALEIVDLRTAADQLVRGYSSGMKQRLGLAHALLGDPELLLLDEPTNALDPAGIHEVRSLIRQLPSRSRATVFLSSHLLAEVENTATHVAIIATGRLKFEGSTRELRSLSQPAIVVEGEPTQTAVRLLSGAGHHVSAVGTRLRIASGENLGPAEINDLLVRNGVAVTFLALEYPTLEDTFLKLTGSECTDVVTEGGPNVLASPSR